jgi:hypothetical protein
LFWDKAVVGREKELYNMYLLESGEQFERIKLEEYGIA